MHICNHYILEFSSEACFAMKNILSIFFTPILALMAFGVAYSQREIAANKYKLDLFFKRFELYNEYTKFYDDLILKPSREKCLDISEIYEKKSILDKLDKLYFSGQYDLVLRVKDLISDTYVDYKNEYPKNSSPSDIEILENNIIDLKYGRFNYDPDTPERMEIELKIKEIQNTIELLRINIKDYNQRKYGNLRKITSASSAIMARLEATLVVPNEPFIPYRKKVCSLFKDFESWIIERDKINY